MGGSESKNRGPAVQVNSTQAAAQHLSGDLDRVKASLGARFEGTLEKKGDGNLFWQTRHFKLQNDSLQWYENNKPSCPMSGELGLHKIEAQAGVLAIEHNGRCINIHTWGGGRVYLMRARTPELAQAWHNAIDEAWSSLRESWLNKRPSVAISQEMPQNLYWDLSSGPTALRSLRELFDLYDVNNNGYLEMQELGEFIKGFCHIVKLPLSESQVTERVQMVCEHRGKSTLNVWHMVAFFTAPTHPLGKRLGEETCEYLQAISADKLVEFQAALAFWEKQLNDSSVLELQTDNPRGAVFSLAPSSRGSVAVPLGLPLWTQLGDWSKLAPHVLLAAWACTLGKHSRQTEVVVGIPGAQTRKHPMCMKVSFAKMNFKNLMDELVPRIEEAMTHAGFSIDAIVTELGLPSDQSRPAVFQTSLVWNCSDYSCTELDLVIETTDAAPRVSVNYSNELFVEETASSIGRRFCVLLQQVLANPEKPLDEVSLMDENEQAEVVLAWNQTGQPWEGNTAYDLLEEGASWDPSKTALAFEGKDMSYDAMMTATAKLAMRLREMGAGSDKVPAAVRSFLSVHVLQVVGLCVEKSIEEVCGMVGIIRSGASYMPLDPKQPSERLEYLCEVTDATLVVAMRKFAGLARAGSHTAASQYCSASSFSDNVVVAEDWLYSDTDVVYQPDPACGRNSLAYCLFTSGSTGKPKGLMIEHGSLVCYLRHQTSLGYKEDALWRSAVSLFLVSFTFDVSVASVWQPLTKGAKLVVSKPGAWLEPHYIENLIKEHKVTHMWAVPSPFSLVLQVMNGQLPPSLKEIHLIGEALPTEMARTVLQNQHVSLFNQYGPAEVTIASHSYQVTPKDLDGISIPIGKTLPNTTSYILDAKLMSVPVGVPGELHLGGRKVSRGYVGRPDLTEKAFISIDNLSDSTIYKTGDLVSWLRGGDIRFLGRVDFQIKLNGQRIETGEIEQVMRNAEGVQDALVMVSETSSGSKQLVGYVIPENVVVDTVMDSCRASLPGYMVPAHIIPLPSWPLNQNQKVDRKMVVKLGAEKRHMTSSQAQTFSHEHAEPTSKLESDIRDVWQRVLGAEKVGVTDNFFTLGGSSITAVRMISEVESICGHTFQLNDVFQHPTVRQLANSLNPESEEAQQEGKFAPFVLINQDILKPTAMSRPPIFICPPAGGLAFPYFNFGSTFGGEMKIYAFQDPALDKRVEFAKTLEELATKFLGYMKSIQPVGPYVLAGWSFGASVALEMAQQLKADGEKVPFVFMLDGYAPREVQDLEEVRRKFNALVHKDKKGWAEGMYVKGGFLKLLSRPFVSKELKDRVNKQGNKKLVTGFSRMMAILDAHLELETSYKPKQYTGRVVNFRPNGDQPWDLALEDDRLWSEQVGCMCDHPAGMGAPTYVSGYQVVEVAGDHGTMMRWPHVRILTERFKAVLSKTLGIPEFEQFEDSISQKGIIYLAPSLNWNESIGNIASVIEELPSNKEAWKGAGIKRLGGWRELDNSIMLKVHVCVTNNGSNRESQPTEFILRRSFDDLVFLIDFLRSEGVIEENEFEIPPEVVRTRSLNPQKLRRRILMVNQMLEQLHQYLYRCEVQSFFSVNRISLN